MDILEFVFLQSIGIISIIIGVLYLGEYVLKRKFNPNREYLEEAKKVALLLIPMIIISLIRHKYILSYLYTKNENTDTRKYVSYKLYFNAIVLTGGAVIYSIFTSYISCKLYGH